MKSALARARDRQGADQPRTDPVERLGCALFYAGLFFSSLLVLRVGPATVGDLLILFSLIMTLIARAMNPTIDWPRRSSNLELSLLLGIAFFVPAVMSAINASSPWESLSVVGRLIVMAFVLPWHARMLLRDGRRLATAIWAFFAGAAVTASGTIVQAVAGAGAIPGADITEAGRFSGFTGHVSDLGGVAAVGAAAGIGLLMTARHRLISGAGLAILAVGLILSGSVSGMIGVIVAALILMVRGAIKWKYALLLVALGILAVSAASSFQASRAALDPLARLLQTLGLSEGGRYSTSAVRLRTFEAAFERIADRPLIGNGFDPISTIADEQFPPHNFIVGAAFQGGVVVAVALVCVVLRAFFTGVNDRTKHGAITFAMATVATWFAMTAPSLYNRYFWIPLALLIAGAAVKGSRSEVADGLRSREKRDAPKASRMHRFRTV